jgi:hypothetical protein
LVRPTALAIWRKKSSTRCVRSNVSPVDFSAYGMAISSSFELPLGRVASVGGARRLRMRLVGGEEIAAAWSGSRGVPGWQTTMAGNCHVRCEAGSAGDHLISFGRRARFHLDRSGTTLRCAPVDPDGEDWRRFLLTTALPCVSTIVGCEALHAAAVTVDGAAVALIAAPGGGKSTVAAELLRRDGELISDDVLAITRANGRIQANPGPPIMAVAGGGVTFPGLGERLGEEAEDGSFWLGVRPAVATPLPLAALFLLERGQAAELRRVAGGAVTGRLLPHALSLSPEPGRALSRLGLLRELAARVPVFRVGLPDDNPRATAEAIAGWRTSLGPQSQSETVGRAAA